MRGNCEEAPSSGDSEGYVKKALGTGICVHRGPVGEPGRGLIGRELRETDIGGLERYVKEDSGNGQLCP